MMKILLLIFSLYLISGPVAHSDVISYSGGGVIIITDLNWDNRNNKYICKKVQTDCVDIIRSNTVRSSVQKDRFMLYRNIYGYLRVLIKKLQPQDAGRYTIGSGYRQNDVDLEVHNDSCCWMTKTIKAYAGENIILTCNYPEHFEENIKHFAKLHDNPVIQEVANTEKMYQNNGKFSISDEKRKKCINVSISDVREEDEGVYLCAVFVSSWKYYYFSFTEIELQVTDTTGTSSVTSTGPTETSSDEANMIPSVIIGVCVCVVLLLIGGLVVMLHRLGCKKKQGSTSLSRSLSDNKDVPMAKEEHIYPISDSDTEVYQNFSSTTDSPAKEAESTEQPAKEHDLTYTTVRFLKNPDDNPVTLSNEESVTEYATVLHQTRK